MLVQTKWRVEVTKQAMSDEKYDREYKGYRYRIAKSEESYHIYASRKSWFGLKEIWVPIKHGSSIASFETEKDAITWYHDDIDTEIDLEEFLKDLEKKNSAKHIFVPVSYEDDEE